MGIIRNLHIGLTGEQFKKGSGCFPCESCGKLTRKSSNTDNTDLCKKCFNEMQEENKEVE